MNTTSLSSQQWQSSKTNNGLHRVRFFISKIVFTDMMKMNKDEIFWDAANQFKHTDIYKWVEENGVVLQWAQDDNLMAWHAQLLFYGDLTERQMVDYTLRFL